MLIQREYLRAIATGQILDGSVDQLSGYSRRIGFNVDSAATVTRVQLSLNVRLT